MTTRREYVEALIQERAFKKQTGQDVADVDAELQRFSDGPLKGVIEAAVPEGLAKPRRSKSAKPDQKSVDEAAQKAAAEAAATEAAQKSAAEAEAAAKAAGSKS